MMSGVGSMRPSQNEWPGGAAQCSRRRPRRVPAAAGHDHALERSSETSNNLDQFIGTPRNSAFTVLPADMVTVQLLPDTESQPVHPMKTESSAGVAVSVTAVPSR